MITTEKLTRHFTSRKGVVEAVRGIDFHVSPGELVAFLGPNGAGKSTTLRMLTTLLPPTSGDAWVAGASISRAPATVRSLIGYIGQGNGAGHSFRVVDELVNQGRLYGMNSSDARRRAGELMRSLDLTGLDTRRVSSLSGGQRRRLDIAIGLMHEPTLLFLDEPSAGMDPQNRANLWDHIGRLRAERETTIVLTTHYLEEADAQAERVLVMDHGQIIADDTAPHLKATLAGDRITVSVGADDVEAAVRVLAAYDPDIAVTARGPETDVAARVENGRRLLPEVLRHLERDQVTVRGADVRVPTLDDVFLSLTGRSLREENEVAA